MEKPAEKGILCADCGERIAEPGESICIACELRQKDKPCSWCNPEKEVTAKTEI